MAEIRAEDEMFLVYDTTILQNEEDEIQDAIICFYPSTISKEHQWELCGQLVGVLHCVQSMTDSPPKSVTLHHNKFAVRRIDKFLVAIGGARSETDGSLQRMIDALFSLFNFYHEGLNCTEKLCQEKNKSFKARIQGIWETYLPLYRQMGDSVTNTFSSLPHIHIPKHSSCIFLRASHLLQICSRQVGVLGGCLVFKDRILCTELNPEISSRLLVIKPKQRNFPGQAVDTDFKLPSGVRILTVYLTKRESEDLQPSKPPWLQQLGAINCTFQNLHEEESHVASDVIHDNSPVSLGAVARSTKGETPPTDRPQSTGNESLTDQTDLSKDTQKSSDKEGNNSEAIHSGATSDSVELHGDNVENECTQTINCDIENGIKTNRLKEEKKPIKPTQGHESLNIMNHDGSDIGANNASSKEEHSHSSNGTLESNSNSTNGPDTADIKVSNGSDTKQLNSSDVPIGAKLLESNNKTEGMQLKRSEIPIGANLSHSNDTSEPIQSESTNTSRDPNLSDSNPVLCMSTEDPPVHRCLQKSHSEEISADFPSERIPSKSTSCSELPRQLSQDKESQTRFLFRRLKRVVSSNTDAIKNYQMLCNASVEVLTPTSPGVAFPTRTTISQSGSRGSISSQSSGQSSGQSHTDVILPRSDLRVLKIEPRNSSDENGAKLLVSPNSEKYGLNADAISPALSTQSLNVPVKSAHSQSSSDDVFKVCHHSFDKSARFRPRRRSKKSSSEPQRSVSFQDQQTTPSGVILYSQEGTLPKNDPRPTNSPSPAPSTASSASKDELFPHNLYIQGNSELLVMLILRDGQGAKAQTVNALWRSILPQLGELDMLVKECVDESSSQHSEAGFNYLTYDNHQKRLRGNTRDPITAIQHHFCGAVTNIHEDFMRMPRLTDIKLRSHNTSVYGHRQGNQETYIQPRGMMKPPVGRPSERDAMVVMDTKDLHRLAKLLKNAVL